MVYSQSHPIYSNRTTSRKVEHLNRMRSNTATSPRPISFKVSIVGPPCVGKTSFVRRHVTGEFSKLYVPTLGVEVHPITFITSSATHPDLAKHITLNLWDTAGQEKYGGLRDGYLVASDIVIAMFNMRDTEEVVNHWIAEAKKANCPIILCANKADLKDKITTKEWTTLPLMRAMRKEQLPFYQVSARSNYNFEKPFLHAIRIVTGVADVIFSEGHATLPPMVELSKEAIEHYQKVLEGELLDDEEDEVHLCSKCSAPITNNM